MKTLGVSFIAIGLLICLAAFLSGCNTALRNGNGLIGNKASAPACWIETPHGIKFYDLRDKECSTSSASRLARR